MTNTMSRRKFLAAVGVGGAAAAAVATQVGNKVGEHAAATGQNVRQGQGYQVTEHVRRYYETTKV
jgi:hypothetical protein